MNKRHWSLFFLYFTAAAAYGGWRGSDVWNGWGIWCFLLPPFGWAAAAYVGAWRLNQNRATIVIGLLMTAFAVVTIGGSAILLAGLVADTTRTFNTPAVRACIGGGLVAALGVATGVSKAFEKPSEPAATVESKVTDTRE